MGKWVHRLTNIDVEAQTATCQECGPVRAKPQRRDGIIKSWRCGAADTNQKRAHREQQQSERYAKSPEQLRFSFGKGRIRCRRLIDRPRHTPGMRRLRGYRRFKDNVCAECGFTSAVRGQFDVHHIDNNHDNDERSNLLTLCANCHRLEHSRTAA